MPFSLNVNGSTHSVDVDGDTPLLWVLRDVLGMTGTKFGCGMALCGACTIHVDGRPTRSCSFPLKAAEGRKLTTIEGVINSDQVAKAVVAAWEDNSVPQCGYCQSGQVMAAVGLLSTKRRPSDAEIDDAMSGNLCRCNTYQRIRAAVHEAARRLGA